LTCAGRESQEQALGLCGGISTDSLARDPHGEEARRRRMSVALPIALERDSVLVILPAVELDDELGIDE
jgi:hypothetical protein